jgi:hypothetical protein
MEKRNVIEAGYGVLLALALSACSSTPPPAAAAGTERSTGDEQVAAPAASAAGARGRDAGARSRAEVALADIVRWINGAPVDEVMYAERFTPDFVASVPYTSFARS